MIISTQHMEKAAKIIITLLAAQFLYGFVKDSYDELFVNPVHFFEDAYMFIRYAKIWHLGYGAAWNSSEGPVYGNTSQLHFLWVLLLTIGQQLSDDTVIKISSYVPAFIFIAWLPWFCSRHSSLFASHAGYQKYILWLGIVGPLIYWNTPFAYHYLTGMDTSLSILMHLLLIDSVLSYSQSKKHAHFIAISIFTYLAYLTRPENILATSLFSVLYLFFIIKDVSAVRKYLVYLSVILVIDAVIKYRYFGDMVPLAFYSKQSGFIQGNSGAGFSHPAFYFFYFLATIFPFIVIQFFALRKDNLARQFVIIAPAVLTLCYFFTMMTVMNMKARYFYPFTPYFLTAALVTFNSHSMDIKKYFKNAILCFVAFALWLGLLVCQQRNGDIVNYFMGNLQLCDDSLKAPASDFAGSGYRTDTDGFKHVVSLLKDTPAAMRVAMTEHGFIGSQVPGTHIIDMTGLHDPYVARHGFSAQWLFERKPDMIWMPHWHYTCMTHEILYSDTFRQHYIFYPGLLTWGIALRKDSVYYDLLNTRLQKQVESMYPGYQLHDFEKQLSN